MTGVVHRPSHRCEFEAVVEDPAERGFRVSMGVGVGAMHDARNYLDALRVSLHEASMEDVPQDITEQWARSKPPALDRNKAEAAVEETSD